MENDLISKKDLLDLTGISYGQLYRWKRKSLIPDEWFIRKSTFTGQETFFPRDRILTRIDKIKNMKEDSSLDEVAEIFSPNPADVHSDKDRLIRERIISEFALNILTETLALPNDLDFEKILFAYVLDKMLSSGDINSEEGKILIRTLDEHYSSFEGRNCEVIFIRKLGVSSCIIISIVNQIGFDPGAKIVSRQNLFTCIEELKQKLSLGEAGHGKQ